MKNEVGHAYIGLDKRVGAIRFTVPHGTSLADALKAIGKIDPSKLPGRGGCPACMCGFEFTIREDFDPVINVQLERGLTFSQE